MLCIVRTFTIDAKLYGAFFVTGMGFHVDVNCVGNLGAIMTE